MHEVAYSLLEEIAHAYRLGEELVQVLKREALVIHAYDLTLPETVLRAKQDFQQAQAKLIKQLEAPAITLEPTELLQLQALQALIVKMETASVDALIEAQPESVALLYERANLLLSEGRDAEAQRDYQAILAIEPTHFATLNDLGKLHMEAGRHSLAKNLIAQAVSAHPEIAVGHLNLADLLLFQSDYALAKQHYQMAIRLDAELSVAHQGLALALSGLGDEITAQKHRDLGFSGQSIITWPHRGGDECISLLVLSSAFGGNVSIKPVLDRRLFHTTVILSEYFPVNTPLPPHQLVINLIGDADLCADGLDIAEKLLASHPQPIINHPCLVKMTGRLQNTQRLVRVPGVQVPRTLLLARTSLLSASVVELLAEQGLDFPLLLRSPGFHTGQFFLRVDTPTELPAVLSRLPGEALLVIQMLKVQNRHGDYHKYRVMFVDGVLYPLHLAISKHWKIHYFSADMDLNPEYREVEAAFLENMPAVLGENALVALEGIRKTLGLDYGGIDFALSDEGEVLLFEANATMAVHRPDDNAKWAYRKMATDNVLAAVRTMILKRAV
jgi:tetratricopeptide (TPR) repeat protein